MIILVDHSPAPERPDSALCDIEVIAMWLLSSFGNDATIWAEMAIASLWRQGDKAGALEWEAVRKVAADIQDGRIDPLKDQAIH